MDLLHVQYSQYSNLYKFMNKWDRRTSEKNLGRKKEISSTSFCFVFVIHIIQFAHLTDLCVFWGGRAKFVMLKQNQKKKDNLLTSIAHSEPKKELSNASKKKVIVINEKKFK